jgi:hypothetical protein
LHDYLIETRKGLGKNSHLLLPYTGESQGGVHVALWLQAFLQGDSINGGAAFYNLYMADFVSPQSGSNIIQ